MTIDLVIDQSTIAELTATVGADFIGELIAAYLDDTPRLIADLELQLANQDAAAFGRIAHSIKSSSASLGALTFAALAKELEMIGKGGNLVGVEPKVKRMAAEYIQVKASLEELKDGS